MRLTQIKLAGFKSFVDPTAIPVPGQLVAVVGPNGCGKSNVIDAVRWVLGESSAKQLRGSSMQDVIFNGSSERRPVGRASVELTFDNSDQQLSGPWGQYAEVSIKRVLTRQGESSYLINNQIVRRRDITDLFLGTGVGARGYAVIEQGMISRIIEAKPEELRAYLEEAAGVSKYKERRRETEHRLADTRDNLLRVDDLRQELQRQIEKLDEQATVAGQYHDLHAALTQQQNLLALLRRDEAARHAAAARAALAQSETSEAELAAQLTALETEEHALRQQQYSAGDRVQTAQQQLADIGAQLVRLEEQQRHRQQHKQRLDKDINDLRQLRQRLAEQRREDEQALDALQPQREQAEQALADIQQMQQDGGLDQPAVVESAFQRSDEQMRQLQTRQTALQRERDLAQQQIGYLQKQLTQQQTRLEALTRERTALNLPDAGQLDQAQQQADEAEQALASVAERLHQDEAKLAELTAQKNRLDETITTTASAHAAAEAEANALSTLLNRQGDDAALESWLHEQGLHEAPLLWQQVQVHADWQSAFEAVLGDRLQARAGHLPGAWPEAGFSLADDHQTSVSTAPDSLRAQVSAAGPFAAALDDWLAGIRCIDAIENAITRRNDLLPGECWLTPQGHRIYRHSVQRHGQHSGGLLAQQAAAEAARQKADELLPALDNLQRQRTTLMNQSGMMNEAIRAQKGMLTRWQQTQNEAALQLAKLTQAIQQGGTRLTALDAECEQLQQESAHSAEELEQTRRQAEDAALAWEELQLTLEEAQQQHQQQEVLLHEQRTASRDIERRLHAAQLVLQASEHKTGELQRRLDELADRDAGLAERLETLLLENSESVDDGLDVALEECLQQRETAEEHLTAEREAFSQTDQQWRELGERQQTVRDALPAVRDQRQQWLLKEQEARLAEERYAEELREAEADIGALLPLLGSAPKISALVNEIARVARAIDNLGAVNLAALQELESARQRYEYLTTQADDLNQAMDMLTAAIAKIDAESRGLLQGTFDQVNGKMREFFPTLFGGGQAQLELTGDDLLEAGIQIIAHPPGKKNSTIHLLSGGEKALTAMSLVFSLFALNPAPFCLLDEVDAPLDDANTGRFCELVKQMSARTQFLYISHNRLTMEMAEQLVGVTMQEQGVSRIVAVDIVQALQMREGAEA